MPKEMKPVVFRKGCSFAEPGITPEADTTVEFKTWDDFTKVCAQSRLWAGVHFQPAIDSAIELCTPIGKACYEKFEYLHG